MKHCQKSKKGRYAIGYHLVKSLLIYQLSTYSEKKLYKRKLHLYEPFQANVEYLIIVMKKEDNCAQLKHIFTCHEQSYCSIQ